MEKLVHGVANGLMGALLGFVVGQWATQDRVESAVKAEVAQSYALYMERAAQLRLRCWRDDPTDERCITGEPYLSFHVLSPVTSYRSIQPHEWTPSK